MIKIFGININKDKFIVFLLLVIITLMGILICAGRKRIKPSAVSPYSENLNSGMEGINIYFEPRSVQLSGITPIKIMADSGSSKIAFARVVFTYNPRNVRIASEIATNPNFSTIVEKTAFEEANESGNVKLVIAASPGDSQPSGKFELATINFATSPGAGDDSQLVSLLTSDMQIVETQAKPVKIIPSDGILMLEDL